MPTLPDQPPLDRSADDAALLAAAQRGDHAAFTAIIERHAKLVHGYLRARLTRLADAEDLGQEVFLRVYTAKAVPREGTGLAMRPWLIGIARNVLREHVRAARRRRETAWTALCLDIEDLVGTAENDGGAFDEVMGRLPRCLEGLGPSARQAIDLYYHDDLRMHEIATRFKRSEGAVKLLVHRARQAVRRCLESGEPVATEGGEEA
ncbi:MAG: RNA polymerase sigma factor [Planctomycetia bacterium]